MRELSRRKSLLQELHGPRFLEQLSFSVAIGAARLSYGLIGSREHAYGWEGDPFDTAIVYHAGGGAVARGATALALRHVRGYRLSSGPFTRTRTDLDLAEQELVEVLRTN